MAVLPGIPPNDIALVGPTIDTPAPDVNINPFNAPEVITRDVKVLIPAALEDAVNEDNVHEVKADIIVEGAMPGSGPRDHAPQI